MAEPSVTVERRDHLLLLGVNRPEKRNAWNLDVIVGVAGGLTELAQDPDLAVDQIVGQQHRSRQAGERDLHRGRYDKRIPDRAQALCTVGLPSRARLSAATWVRACRNSSGRHGVTAGPPPAATTAAGPGSIRALGSRR